LTSFEQDLLLEGARFEGEANLERIHIGSLAMFTGASFKQTVSLNGAQIADSAYFDSTSFMGEADFESVRIGGQAAFRGASFKDELFLQAVTVTGDLLLREASFTKRVSLLNASCRTMFLSLEGDETLQISFGQDAALDLRRCTYDRVHPISSWRTLMSLQQPYSRDPFNYLEQSLRRAGNDGEATEVYYERRFQELHQKKKWCPAWITDTLLRYLTGFGVRVSWLLYYIIPILVAGTIIFSLDGALEPKQPTSPISVPSSVSEAEKSQGISAVRLINAALISLDLFFPLPIEGIPIASDLFLPIGDIPTVGEWQISSGTVWGVPWLTLWATFMIVTGWILVPIGIVGLTGQLKR
jgi:hypothetical protein